MSDERKARLLKEGDKFGDYTVVRLLGKGGMGAVYLMRGASGSQCAVKVMYPDKVSHEMRRRFLYEAEFAIKIRHRNLVPVYDVGEDPETGLCYMIMDYMPGGSLADRLKRRGRLPVREAVSIAAQVALGLDEAHRHGLVHRDVKPDNVLFDADGMPRLADLGIAKFEGGDMSKVTTTNMVIGTPAYMAPEQMLNSHEIDARADIYSLGVSLYEMLTGRRPNEDRQLVELIAKALNGEPLFDVRTLPPGLPEAVGHVLSSMCAPKPEDRPQTALAAADLLRRAASGKLVLEKKKPNVSAAETAALRAKRRKLAGVGVGLVGLAAFLAVGIAGWVKALSRQEPVQPVNRVVVTTNVVDVVVTNDVAVIRTNDVAVVCTNVVAVVRTNVVAVVRTNVVAVVRTNVVEFTRANVVGVVRTNVLDAVQLWKGGPYWAAINIGAKKPWEYGYYFWWGDTVGYKHKGKAWVANDRPSSKFSFSNGNLIGNQTCNKSIDALRSEGWITEDYGLKPEHDAAHVHRGGGWRMPTYQELKDLNDRCDWRWTKVKGVNGYRVCGLGKYASNSIFLPCAGYGGGSSLYSSGSYGNYWSSVPYSNSVHSSYLNFGSDYRNTVGGNRYYGFSIRPVQGDVKSRTK